MLRGSVEKLSPKESFKGANTVLRGNVTATKGKPKAAKPVWFGLVWQPRVCPKDFQQLLRLPKS